MVRRTLRYHGAVVWGFLSDRKQFNSTGRYGAFYVGQSQSGHADVTVDGVSVTKTLQRQTWTNEDYTGIYAGGYSVRAASCVPASRDGIQEVFGLLSINQTGSNVFMSVVSTVANCSFSGAYTQAGKLGQVQGTYSCTDGISGTFVSYEMAPTENGFTAQISGQNQFCQWDGFFGGNARAQ